MRRFMILDKSAYFVPGHNLFQLYQPAYQHWQAGMQVVKDFIRETVSVIDIRGLIEREAQLCFPGYTSQYFKGQFGNRRGPVG